MTDLNELLERVKKATGPDRDIDHALLSVAGWKLDILPRSEIEYWTNGDGERTYFRDEAPDYTASIDASLALVERVLPGWMWSFGNVGPDDICWACLTSLEGDCPDFDAGAPTPALTILAALLSALISKEAQS